MSMISVSGVQDAGAGLWAQVQEQQAQRAADQAEQKARSLRTQASNAQAIAVRAQENARTLKIQSSQADNDANNALMGLAQSRSMSKVQSNLSDLHQQLTSVLATPAASTVSTSTAQPVLNAEGQTTGAVISVKA